MASTPTIVKLLMFTGQIVFAFFYGTLGTILTILQFFRLGPNKFFRRVSRPIPPALATDPIYGKHDMIKLKVILFFSELILKKYSSHLMLLFIMFQKVHQINH
jgi:hypothetical protein